MPSFKLSTKGYTGGSWQGPGTSLYTYRSGSWQVPDNAFYYSGSAWVRFFGDDVLFNHGNLSIRGVGYDELQGGEGGDPFWLHFYGSGRYTLKTDGTVEYEGLGTTGSTPGSTSGTWAEAGITSSLYEVQWNQAGYGATWYDLAGQIDFLVNEGNYGDYSGTLQIRHKESQIVVSSFTLAINVD
jgi:hypothetical protein